MPHFRAHLRLVLSLSIVLVLLSGRLASAQNGPDIPTWQFDTKHTGVNASETTLTPGFVSTSGNMTLLYTEQFDGQVFAQPLFLSARELSPSWGEPGRTAINIKMLCSFLRRMPPCTPLTATRSLTTRRIPAFRIQFGSSTSVPLGNTTAVAQQRSTPTPQMTSIRSSARQRPL